LIYYFKHIVFIDEYFLYFAIHHRFISAVLYLIGIISSVFLLIQASYSSS
jgi:phosphatidate cytidylyltransferase